MDGAQASQRILVVDDDPTIRNVMEKWFSRRGFSVTAAFDGEDAVQKCRSESFDVITMDLEMPRMNGFEATHIIKGENPCIPVIVVSGYTHDMERLQADNVAAVLKKPVLMSVLEEAVRAALRRAPSRMKPAETPGKPHQLTV